MNKKNAYIMLITITILWGISFPVMDYLLNHINPYNFIMIRYLISAILMTIIYFKTIKSIDYKHIKASISIGVPFAIAAISQMVGLEKTTSTNAAFITGLTVIIVPIIMWIFDKVKPNGWTKVGIIGSLIGVAIMTNVTSFKSINIGDVIVFIGTIGFGGQICLIGKLASKLDPIKLTLIQFYVVSICTMPFVNIDNLANMQLDFKMVLGLCFIVCVCTVFALTVQNKVQHYVSSAHVGIIFLLEPVASIIFSKLLGDIISINQVIGALLIILSMIIILLKGNK